MQHSLLHPLKTTLLLAAALCVATVLGAAKPGSSGANPIATGDAIHLGMVGELHLEFSLIEMPDGTLIGGGVSAAVDGALAFELTSYEQIGDVLCMAGPITASGNTPFEVGQTWLLCIEDNGNGGSGVADKVATAVLPPGFTIQFILENFPGFLPPPASQFSDILEGNLKVH